MIFKAFKFIILGLIIQNLSYSQPIGMDLLGNKDKIEIPFEYDHGFIIVKIRINKTLPLKFIFDTGAEHTILFHKTYGDLLGFQYSKRIEIIGSDLTEEIYALIARNIYFDLPNVNSVKRDLLVLENNQMVLEETIGIRLDGILGGSFFRGLVVNIDYRKKKIIFYEPNKYKPPSKDYEEFDITIHSNKPYLNTKSILTTGDTIPTKLLIDTGAALPFLLHTNTDSSLVMPDYVIRGNIGQGMGGIIFGFLGKIENLMIGSFEFNHILTSFQDIDLAIRSPEDVIRNGILGNTLLSRFYVIIDYLRGRFYLKPRKNYNEDFGYDKSGLVIFAFGQKLDKFIVKSVVPGSPAFDADIRPGDIIIKIGWRKSKHWTLDKLNKKLQQKDGKCIKMTIDRDGKKMKKKFYLRDLLTSHEKGRPTKA